MIENFKKTVAQVTMNAVSCSDNSGEEGKKMVEVMPPPKRVRLYTAKQIQQMSQDAFEARKDVTYEYFADQLIGLPTGAEMYLPYTSSCAYSTLLALLSIYPDGQYVARFCKEGEDPNKYIFILYQSKGQNNFVEIARFLSYSKIELHYFVVTRFYHNYMQIQQGDVIRYVVNFQVSFEEKDIVLHFDEVVTQDPFLVKVQGVLPFTLPRSIPTDLMFDFEFMPEKTLILEFDHDKCLEGESLIAVPRAATLIVVEQAEIKDVQTFYFFEARHLLRGISQFTTKTEFLRHLQEFLLKDYTLHMRHLRNDSFFFEGDFGSGRLQRPGLRKIKYDSQDYYHLDVEEMIPQMFLSLGVVSLKIECHDSLAPHLSHLLPFQYQESITKQWLSHRSVLGDRPSLPSALLMFYYWKYMQDHILNSLQDFWLLLYTKKKLLNEFPPASIFEYWKPEVSNTNIGMFLCEGSKDYRLLKTAIFSLTHPSSSWAAVVASLNSVPYSITKSLITAGSFSKRYTDEVFKSVMFLNLMSKKGARSFLRSLNKRPFPHGISFAENGVYQNDNISNTGDIDFLATWLIQCTLCYMKLPSRCFLASQIRQNGYCNSCLYKTRVDT